MTELNNSQAQNELQLLGENIKRYIFISVGFWYLFVIAIVLSLGFAKLKNRYAKNLYSIYTTIYVQSNNSSPEVYAGGIPFASRVNLENEIGVLTSYSLNYRVMQELEDFHISYYLKNKFSSDLELYKISPIKVIYDTLFSPLYGVKVNVKILDSNRIEVWIDKKDKQELEFGQIFETNNARLLIEKTEHFSSNYIGKEIYVIRKSVDALAHSYSQRLRIDRRSPGSTILWLWLETTVPRKDIDYLNKLADLYIQRRLERKNEIAVKTIEFIDQQLNIFSDSLKRTEDKLQYFKQNNIQISDQGEGLNEQISTLELEIKKLELKQTYYKQLLQTLQESKYQSIIPPAAVGLEDPILETYLQNLTEAIFDKQSLDLTVKQTNAIPIAEQKQLKIEQIRQSLMLYIEQSLKYTQGSIEELKKKIQDLETELKQLPINERQFMQLNRKFNINNQMYTFLLERRMEAGISLASSKPDAEIIDRAVMNTIRFKRKIGYISAFKALSFGLIIVIIIITTIFLFDNKIKNKTEIEHLTQIPIVGTITHNASNSLVPVVENPRSTIAESFRSLKTNLMYFMVDTPAQSILVSSTVSGEGKSFIASNLAALFAFTNKKTVILEADMRKPQIHKNFKISKSIGISTYLIGENTYEEILVKTKIDNLWIIPSGEIPPNPVELLESRKMQELMERLRKDFDIIVADSPPVGIVTDALILARYTDIFLFVVRQLYSTKQSIRLINELKYKNKINRIAITVNDIKTSLLYGMRYGYGYSYSYGYGYGYGYGYYEEEEQATSKWDKFKLKIRRIITNIIR